MSLTGMDLILKGLPNGLSFNLSENGVELSGGQKQILALTRAIISEPSVVLLDEPTSAMDPRHEQLFIRQIAQFAKDRTFIVVTHRKPILALTERIIMVESGEIAIDGPEMTSSQNLNKFFWLSSICFIALVTWSFTFELDKSVIAREKLNLSENQSLSKIGLKEKF